MVDDDWEESEAPDRILIVGPSWVGDMVMSQTLYKLLRKRQPETAIDVMASPAVLPLVSRMAEVDRGVKFDLKHGELGLTRRRLFGEALQKNNYKQAIILPNSMKSALVPFHANIPVRTGFRGEYRYVFLNDMRMLNKRELPRMIDRFAALGVKIGQPLPELEYPELMVNDSNQAKLLDKFSLTLDRPVVAICPGAEFGDAKRWPEQHYAELADRLIAEGNQVWILGGPGDQEIATIIKELMNLPLLEHLTDLTGQTSLLDVIDLIAMSQLVVSNDSGLMHVAAAVGVETMVIYGSTSPEFTPPLTEKVSIQKLDNMACAPCFKRTCPLKHKNCLNQLEPERVHAAAVEVLARS